MDALELVRFDQLGDGLVLDGGGDDQQGSLHLLDGIDVVLDDGVHH